MNRERCYVGFDKYIPYFVENYGCGICIGVCPWSAAGHGESISDKISDKLFALYEKTIGKAI